MTYRDPATVDLQFRAAERLGKMVALGELSQDNAGQVMATIVRVAHERAPDVDRSGLAVRLVWTAKDAREKETLETVRRAKDQEKQLVAIAEAGYREGLPIADIRRNIAAAAKGMNPLPPLEMGDASMRLGKWRAKNG